MMRTLALPAPPSTSAHCTSDWNPVVCARPISAVSRQGVGASDSPRSATTANSTSVARTARSAAKWKGPAQASTCFITIQL